MSQRFPGGADEAYKLYLLVGQDLRCVASCADPQALGVALATLHDEGELNGGRVGVYRGLNDGDGEWLVSPFAGQSVKA